MTTRDLQPDQAVPVLMLHFECEACEMAATMVDTPSASRAWEDHMMTHDDPQRFRAWAWEVFPLPFE